MKRFILSGIVIGFFVLFSLYYRMTSPPSLLTTPPTPEPSPTPTPQQQAVQSSSQAPTNMPVATNTPTLPPSTGYKDGTFTGDPADALYGNIQVQIVMNSGKITDVQFLQYPNDRDHSIQINQYAMPILKSEAIQVQSASVDIVSGATDSSQAFIQSLQSALDKAKS